ncbi:MAG TPA: MFS transporter [Silvibacterium sp.]|nr:MFS transporter [Silvibacterium sp.]
MLKAPDQGTSTMWHPLSAPIFRNLLIADLVSDVGTFMQSVGAAWLMVSLHAGPLYVSLIQTASALPFFMFALPAGALGDIVDRRKLILLSEIWNAGAAMALFAVAVTGHISPLLLLILTFAFSAGDALESPAWQAALPEMVSQDDLAPAAALNGIEFNLARAIGPALGGFLIAIAGASTAFLINAVSNSGVIFVLARWKRQVRKPATPPETLTGATVAGIRYIRFSPALRALGWRLGIVAFFGSGLLALLPSVAHSAIESPIGYGILLGCFGLGGILGGLVMQQVRAHWSAEVVISSVTLLLGLMTIAAGILHSFLALAVSVLIAGASAILYVSLFNVMFLTQTPRWVQARVLALGIMVFQGAMAAGSAVWGTVAIRISIHFALICAGLGIIASTLLGLFLKLPETTVALIPWSHWRVPAALAGNPAIDDAGPILVTIEYPILPEHEAAFVQALYEYGRIRRRDGAYRWGVFRDLEKPHHYMELYLVNSWAEHLRQHERSTLADRGVEDRVFSYVSGKAIARHLVYRKPES